MRNKKVFNNLFDSICITLLLIFCIFLYLIAIWFGVFHTDRTNPVSTMIIFTLFFGSIIIYSLFIIFKYCYEYWLLTEDSIYSKKLFRKKVEIKLNEIDSVEKRVVSVLVLGIYKSEAYIIHCKNIKIVVLLKEHKVFDDLDYELDKFINKIS